jgi:hypothetical protein
MRMNKTIREALGLGPKNDDAELAKLDETTGYVAQGEDGPHTPIEYVDSKVLNTKHSDVVPVPADGKAQAVNVKPPKVEAKPLSLAMELVLAEKRLEAAGEALGAFEVTRGMRTLMERALDNVAKNTGQNLEDPAAKAKADAFATIVLVSGHDLAVALEILVESEAPSKLAGTVYSFLYTVLKAAVFLGNLDYRRALDPESDLDTTLYADKRDAHRDAPPGLQGDPVETPVEDLITQALGDLQLFLTLTANVHGWDPKGSDGEPTGELIPFDNVMSANGASFTPIRSVSEALDRQEVKRKAAQAKRADAFASLKAKSAEAAKGIMARVLARKH